MLPETFRNVIFDKIIDSIEGDMLWRQSKVFIDTFYGDLSSAITRCTSSNYEDLLSAITNLKKAEYHNDNTDEGKAHMYFCKVVDAFIAKEERRNV